MRNLVALMKNGLVLVLRHKYEILYKEIEYGLVIVVLYFFLF
ncbi:hypothetical protein SAMN05216455_10160 [Segatella bryantii]|nr:hypothetical protein SAMN05216455_10160 [Segatella bryantii]